MQMQPKPAPKAAPTSEHHHVAVRAPPTPAELQAAEERTAEQERIREFQRLEEEQRQISREVQYLTALWPDFLNKKHILPPNLLPLEQIAELEAFRSVRYATSELSYQHEAFEQFILQTIAPLEAQLNQYQKFAKRVQRSVRGIRQVFRRMFGNALAKLLKNCRIEYNPPHIGAPGSKAMASASRLLRGQWNPQIDLDQQALLSIHSDEAMTTIQVGSGALGSAYITFDGKFDPIALAEKFMALVSSDLEALFHPDGVVTIYDGEMDKLNPKQFLKKHRIVRSRRDNFEGVKERLAHVISAPAPRPEDTAIHFGVPEDAAQLESVFASSSEHDEPQVWAEWSPIAPLWKEISEQHGFTDHLRSTDAEVLQSLATKRNVIIVVAHAEGKAIHLPAPPPKGSTISSDELQAHRDAIAENSPMVYLFCCETAKIDGITSFVDELLDCGVRAVVAPQTKIGAISSSRLFDQFLAGGKAELSMLSSLQRAEEISEYREMETWIG